MFGQTVTISSDVLRQFTARGQAQARRNTSSSTATPTAAASCRYKYRSDNFSNAVQFAVGLELFLLIDDPWRVFFTTDHPNGAPVHRLSGSVRAADEPRSAREMAGRTAGGSARGDDAAVARRANIRCDEIATMTRAAPAKLLGLRDRGHLGARRARRCRGLSDRGRSRRDVPLRCARLQGRRSRRARRRVTHYRYGRALTRRAEL